MKNIHCLLVPLALVFAVTACMDDTEESGEFIAPTPTILRLSRPTVSPTPPILVIGDGGLLSAEPCGPPCFWGIEPGKTTQSEAFQILTNLGVMEVCENYEYFDNLINEWVGGWTCQSEFDYRFEKPKGFGLSFRKSTGIIDTVSFKPTIPITLQDIVVKHGFPDAVRVVNLGGEHDPNLSANIYYFDLRIVLGIGEIQEEWKYKVLPTTLINRANYQDEQTLKDDFDIFGENIIPWKGYGEYQVP